MERMTIEKNENPTSELSVMEDRLFIRHKDQLVMVPMEHILFLKADRSYCKIFTKDQEFYVSTPLGNLEPHLNGNDFIRAHRSFIVNIKAITAIHENHEYLTIDHHLIPISRRLREKIVSRFKMI